jgi:hypothetical protein
MNTQSTKKLEKYLDQYSIDLDYWSNEIMETHETVGIREALEESIATLTPAMRERLSALDAKAKAILDAYQGDETWDVTMLREVVAIAYPERR